MLPYKDNKLAYGCLSCCQSVLYSRIVVPGEPSSSNTPPGVSDTWYFAKCCGSVLCPEVKWEPQEEPTEAGPEI